MSALDTTALAWDLAELLGEWREWFGSRPQQTRQIFQKLVAAVESRMFRN